MSLLQLRRWFFQKKLYVFDLDGTLYLQNRPLPGAHRLISRLRRQKKHLLFLSNNSSRHVDEYFQRLHRWGWVSSVSEILLSTHQLIEELKRRAWKQVFVLGTPSMKRMLRDSGIKHVRTRPRAVVIGFDKTLNYKNLEYACQLIARGLPYIVTHPDRYCPSIKGPQPDCGALSAAVETATSKKAVKVLGKPDLGVLRLARRRIRVPKKGMVLIGDRLSTDIALAQNYGIESLLMLSGDSRRKDLKKGPWKPTHQLSSLEQLSTRKSD